MAWWSVRFRVAYTSGLHSGLERHSFVNFCLPYIHVMGFNFGMFFLSVSFRIVCVVNDRQLIGRPVWLHGLISLTWPLVLSHVAFNIRWRKHFFDEDYATFTWFLSVTNRCHRKERENETNQDTKSIKNHCVPKNSYSPRTAHKMD